MLENLGKSPDAVALHIVTVFEMQKLVKFYNI